MRGGGPRQRMRARKVFEKVWNGFGGKLDSSGALALCHQPAHFATKSQLHDLDTCSFQANETKQATKMIGFAGHHVSVPSLAVTQNATASRKVAATRTRQLGKAHNSSLGWLGCAGKQVHGHIYLFRGGRGQGPSIAWLLLGLALLVRCCNSSALDRRAGHVGKE